MIRTLALAAAFLLLPSATFAQFGGGRHIGVGGIGGVGIGVGNGYVGRNYLGSGYMGGGYNYRGFGYPSYASGFSGLGYGYRGLGYGGLALGYRGGYGYGYAPPYYVGGNNFYGGNVINSYPYGYNGVYGPYSVYGPLTLPSGNLYGVGAAQSVLPAMQPLPVLPSGGNVRTTVILPANNNANPNNAKPAVREPGDRKGSQERLAAGDAEFGKQLFQSAYLEYQKAKQADPNWAEPYFRRGWALAAIGRYHLAAESFAEGFKRDPQWTESAFRIDDLYGDNKIAKEAHIDAMATAAKAEPTNSDVWMILGLVLYFDGQQQRSQPFFNRSAETAPVSDQGLLKSFIKPQQVAAEDREI